MWHLQCSKVLLQEAAKTAEWKSETAKASLCPVVIRSECYSELQHQTSKKMKYYVSETRETFEGRTFSQIITWKQLAGYKRRNWWVATTMKAGGSPVAAAGVIGPGTAK